jgi:choline kinase
MFGAVPDVKSLPMDDNEQVETLTHLVDQISLWIKEERSKRNKLRQEHPPPGEAPATPQSLPDNAVDSSKDKDNSRSESDFDLDKLERIVTSNLVASKYPFRQGSVSVRRKSSIRKLRRKPSGFTSDTDHADGEFHVPSCDVVLDNSKTLAYTGGALDSSGESSSDEQSRAVSFRDQDAWASFKFEIVRLTHTLRLKGWRRVPMEMSDEITVQRLSGALTNAVYVVSPPDNLPTSKEDASGNSVHVKPTPKILMRIYGPQVEHLIDREAELAILRRLARKHIGPRMLGTFANGRFEEFFHAQTLTPDDLRNPDTSRQIAKRMRELHDGMDLLEEERDEGPFVWRNWDKWLARVEQIVTWMDSQVEQLEPGVKPTGSKSWLRRGYILGVPWAQFRAVVEKYRSWLRDQYCDAQKLRERLVFAHNDTQYGNILRLVPTGESPLLLPANTHKQLVVIDFEYSSANTRGLEFANHFTEWCYNYHDKRKPYACNVSKYPSPEDQESFLRSYVRHRPQFNYDTPKMSPMDAPSERPRVATRKSSSNRLSEFMLDARMPRSNSGNVVTRDIDAAAKADEDAKVAQLAEETRIWRLANTAQWVAWAVVQAKIPGLPEFPSDVKTPGGTITDTIEESAQEGLAERADEYKTLVAAEESSSNTAVASKEKEEQQEEEFDYLGYAQHRCMFFWGDAIQLGLVKAEDLPEEMKSKIKHVPL